ncbi:MAG: hypothetical protein IKU13_04250 [Clostridia bacterium]|nr:hypothetical protein [Clostridia bacterium]
MSFTIFEQVNILLYSSLFGCVCGIIFLLHNYAYRWLRHGVSRFVLDFLMSIICSALYFLFVLTVCKGRISLYQILFFIVGVWLIRNMTNKNSKK